MEQIQKVPQPMEMAFAKVILNRIDFRSIGHHHMKFRSSARSNSYPSIKLDMRDQLYDKLVSIPDKQDNWKLEERVLEDFYYWFGEDEAYSERENGFELFWDEDGYNLMCDLPLYSLFLERQEEEEEIDYIYKALEREGLDSIEIAEEKERLADHLGRIEEIDQEIIECAKKYLKFEQIAEWLKHEFDYFVVIFKEAEDEYDDDEFDLVDQCRFEDELQAEGWKLWEPEKEIRDAIEEEVDEIGNEQTFIAAKKFGKQHDKHLKKAGIVAAYNSLTYGGWYCDI